MLKNFFASTSSVVIVGGVLTILAAGLGGGAPAYADEAAPRSVRVSYADLDLRAPAGQRVLQARVRRAAKHVCRQDGVAHLVARPKERACEAESVEAALRQTPLTTQLAQSR